ncbi:hypothetical protein AQUCO_03700100v1 [Aquilegia coerulea]|uniref:Uncharacterized protein n=1 Tax=Aquilegia coerulea TaxID=218851 RepID=A0A2G5CUK0_AQUCA|nr:hypothetical protein AQUCO_03700100v1 [Aquilegia coerulea]
MNDADAPGGTPIMRQPVLIEKPHGHSPVLENLSRDDCGNRREHEIEKKNDMDGDTHLSNAAMDYTELDLDCLSSSHHQPAFRKSFRKISECKSILSDPEKLKRYKYFEETPIQPQALPFIVDKEKRFAVISTWERESDWHNYSDADVVYFKREWYIFEKNLWNC